MTEPSPARLHVLLARTAPLAVVIRRGPSKKVATLLWDRTNDEFSLGQWLKGRIYERRCDLSPDGKYLIYFALNGKWNSESKGTWTAISRAPYLKAVEFFPYGETYFGGGLWTGPTTYWLDAAGPVPPSQSGLVQPDVNFRPRGADGVYSTIYHSRLLNGGWQSLTGNAIAKHRIESVFEKELTSGWKLRKRDTDVSQRPAGQGHQWEAHQLISPGGESVIDQPDWEWADWDGKRLMWASLGRLFAATIRSQGIFQPQQLHDFNSMQFEAIEAPY